MDSIIDSFFPYLDIIEKEVMGIERTVFSVGDDFTELEELASVKTERQTSSDSGATFFNEKITAAILAEKGSLVEIARASTRSIARRPRFTTPPSLPLFIRRVRRVISKNLAAIPRFKTMDAASSNHFHSATMVGRIARVRRLVTSLTRFLAVKSEVVAQVKKRLLAKGEWSLGTGTEDDLDVFVYMGDVQGMLLIDIPDRRSYTDYRPQTIS